MRWKQVVVGLTLAVTGMVGCKQQCYLYECDADHYSTLSIPHLDTNANASIMPVTPEVPTPANVLNPEREIRFLTLTEAIAMALEHGFMPGGVTGQGFQPPVFQAIQATIGGVTGVSSSTGSVRALALDSALAATGIDAALSKFDARWTSGLTWTTDDRPVGTALDSFQAFGRQAVQNTNAAYSTGLVKPLPTGGVAGITFRTEYQLSNLAVARVNPAYRPTLQFGFEQPLLRGFGVEINQLRAAHPGVQLNNINQLQPFDTGGRVQGILITRVGFDIARAQFEGQISQLVLNVEVAYWNLYGAYWTLYSREQALRQAYEAWKINKARFEAGRIAIQDFAQTRVQYEDFRGQRLQALGQVLENERQLRAIIGLPVEDGCRLVPVDQPTLSPYQPDWCVSLNEALTLRPDLVMFRNDLKARQLEIIDQKNALLPDLRLGGSYDFNGIGTRLDGPQDDNAFRSLASMKFSNWALGLRMEVPLGYREQHANVRAARLRLARTYHGLQFQELVVQSYLAQQYRSVLEFYEQIKIQRARRLAAADQLEARFKEFLAGRGTLDILLEAQRNWADALSREYENIVNYNNALASFEWAKGTILQHDNIHLAEGPLPPCAQVRAVEHERERSKSLVLRERQNPVIIPSCSPEKGCPGLPQLPADSAPSIPAILEGRKSMPELPEQLPGPKPELVPAPKSEEVQKPSASSPAPLPALPLSSDPLLTPSSGKPAAPPAPAKPAAATPGPLEVLGGKAPRLPELRTSPYQPILPKPSSPPSPSDKK